MPHRISVAAASDVGCKRTNNEDSFGYDQAAGIFVVSDGMGGGAAGEVASHIAVRDTLANYGRMRQDSRLSLLPAQTQLFFSVVQANTSVYEAASRDSTLKGMGATLVAVCLDGPNAIVANMGDSRAYLLRQGGCSQITQDHSLAAEQVRNGLLTAEEAENQLNLNVITRALGVGTNGEPDLFAAELLPGDRLLLATDGLMKHVSDPEIGAIVQAAENVTDACEQLIRVVKQRGALDNVTCLLLHALPESESGS